MSHLADSLKIDKLCREVQIELDAYERFTNLNAPLLAPGFNVTELLYPDENRLSSVLAALLDPKGEHGQGSIFLRYFLEEITNSPSTEEERTEGQSKCIDRILSRDFTSSNGRALEVVTNLIENNQRRIDILLDLGGFSLAFENKPRCGDQPNQVSDYLSYLKSRHNNVPETYLLVYLSGNGSPPSEDSISDNQRAKAENDGTLMVASYPQLIGWLEKCSSTCQSDKVRFFLNDFKDYIRREFVGGLEVVDEKIVIERSVTEDNISAAVAIGYAWPKIALNLIEQLCSQLMQSDFLGDSWADPEVSFDINSTNSGFTFSKKSWKNYCFAFEFEYKNSCSFAFGVYKDTKGPAKPEIKGILDAKLCKGKLSGGWPWYQLFNDPYLNWGGNHSAWAGIPNNGPTVQEVQRVLKLLVTSVEGIIDDHEKLLAAS